MSSTLKQALDFLVYVLAWSLVVYAVIFMIPLIPMFIQMLLAGKFLPIAISLDPFWFYAPPMVIALAKLMSSPD